MTGGWLVLEASIIAAVLLSLASVLLVRKGNRQINTAMVRAFSTDDQLPSSNVSIIDTHRQAATCTLPGCPVHGGSAA